MDMEVTKVYRQTNSLATVIPKSIVEHLSLDKGDYITWEIIDNKVIIYKLEKA